MTQQFLILAVLIFLIALVAALWVLPNKYKLKNKGGIVPEKNTTEEALSKLKHGDCIRVFIKRKNKTQRSYVIANIPSEKKIEIVDSKWWDYGFGIDTNKEVYAYAQISDGFLDMNKTPQTASAAKTQSENTYKRIKTDYNNFNGSATQKEGGRAPKIN